jgi:EpsD family peptidyl-prolyl cis-trans isomerase
MKFHHRISLIALIGALALTAGCSKKSEEKKVATQVAAKINSTEITVSQVSNILARTPNIPPEAADKAKRDILDKLIDQQLAREQAIDKKLDRSPNVMQAIEAAKTEILARAYLERIAAEQPKPTPEEVKKYYAEHPELFAARRVFNLEEIDVAPKEGVVTALAEQAAKARSMEDIATWLKSRDTKFTANRGVRAAEQIPIEMLPKLQAMKDGETKVFETPGGARQVIRVVASKAAPVDEATAAPRIQQYLFNRRSSEAIAKEMKRVKDGAKIEYLGEFAGGAAAAEAKAKAEAEAKAKELAAANAKKEAEAKATSEAIAKARKEEETAARLAAEAKAKATPSKPVQLQQQTIEKGVGGLK